ncbi:MAG TPA: biotin/lipoyl-binding protein, partial [Rhodospirillales bacterium]
LALAFMLWPKGGAQQPQMPPPAVTVVQPVVREVVEWDEYTGRFGALEYVEVRAQVSGYLDKIHFADGQRVKEGELPFTIDQRPFKLASDQADAEVKQAETRLELAFTPVFYVLVQGLAMRLRAGRGSASKAGGAA